MINCKCKVLDEKGKKKTIKMLVEDEIALKVYMKEQGYYLVDYKVIPEKRHNSFFTLSFSVKRKEVVLFLRQFSVMINSGVSVDDTLNTLRMQNFSKGFKEVLDNIYSDVLSGNLLSDAFRVHPEVFPNFFCNMVEIGELSGSLDTVLSSMADYYENEETIKSKARSSLAYPIVLEVLIIAVILFMIYFILPEFEGLFSEFEGEIPPISKTVFSIGAFLRNNMLIILGVIAFLVLFTILFFKTKPGKKVKSFLALHLPVIGKVNHAVITSRFSRTFAILLKSGMNITDCMNNLVNVIGNVIYKEKFIGAIEEIRRGKTIARSLTNAKVFNPILVRMIDVGEKSGNLEEVLNSTTVFFDNEVDSSINKAIALLEPITIIILGFIVAVVLLSIYIPMIELMNAI